MTPERWALIEQVYHSALAQPAETRSTFLAEACRGDSGLRREVQSLLAQDGNADFLSTPLVHIDTRTQLPSDDNSSSPASDSPEFSAARFSPGQIFVSRYRLEALLGRGGMGEVYRAVDLHLRRDVAIKVLTREFADDPQRLRRFEQEALAVAALAHANILTIHDIGKDPVPFLVTELLDGETLRTVLDRGPLPLSQLLDVVLQLTNGLAAAHTRGIVHRDLKPGNVFITHAGTVKILDFGLAKVIQPFATRLHSPISSASTLEGTVVGTIGYMAPEQVRGGTIDHRTDIFALGLLVYEMTTGRRAFPGDSPADVLSDILKQQPPEPTQNIPPRLLGVIRQCLEKDPARRFQSVRGLHDAVASVADRASLGPARTPGHRSVAVLPFANLSADPENVFFGDGLAEELINGLARIPQLRVASRTSAFRFRDGDHDVREIARQLNVDAVLEGSVRRIGKRVRISVQLVNAIDGYQLWSERYDREMVDIFTIEDEITTSIVSTLEPTLLGGPQVSKRHTGNPQAYELYLKGRHFWDQRTGQTLRAALECFEGAVDFDPGYALAYAGIADCYSMLAIYDFIPREEGRPRALLAAQTAMTLDEALPECHYTMALFTIFFEEDWSQGGAHFVRARELSPRAAHIVVHHAVFLAARHERGEARAVARRAIELDPLSPFVHTVAAFTMYVSRSHLEAIRCAERALDLDPGYAQGLIVLGLASCAVGDDEHAIEAFTRLVSVSKRTTLFTALLAFAHARAGREDEARTILRELEARQQKDFVGPFSRWAVCLGLDDTDALCTWFDACIADGVTGYAFELFFGPFLDALTVDPRLAEYLRRLSIVLRSRG